LILADTQALLGFVDQDPAANGARENGASPSPQRARTDQMHNINFRWQNLCVTAIQKSQLSQAGFCSKMAHDLFKN
jgi:hypothetical protein